MTRAADSAATPAGKLGLAPSVLVHVGTRYCDRMGWAALAYGPDGAEDLPVAGPEDLADLVGRPGVLWLDLTGVHDVDAVAGVGEALGIHPLVLADVVNTHQRPKAEIHDGYLFAVVKMVSWDAVAGALDVEQVSLLLGPGWVVTFQERPGDVFEAVRTRIRGGKGRIRGAGADYLFYALLDVVVDHYFLAVEALGDLTEAMEDEVLGEPTPATLERIHGLRREALALRRAAWPLRELVQGVLRDETGLVDEATRPYLRDVHDHALQVMDSVENQREILSSCQDLYLSALSNRMNEVMKVLTVIATLFIPLTFIAGVYGMNFEHMPELHWRWGYAAVWAAMAGAAGALLWFFRRRGWL